MKINIIVSVSENWVIGKNNKLLWKLSNDLKRFKELTSWNTVIMGQKTFESLPNGALPNRVNIVLTDDPKFIAKDAITVRSVPESLEIAIASTKQHEDSDNDIFIIGGGMVYKQFLKYADSIYLTKVHVNIDGDTFFPEINENEWKLVSEEFKSKDDKNEFDHTYQIYNRKNNL